MFQLNIEKKTKILLTVGIIITILGFVIHFSYPSEMVTASGDENSIMNELETYDGFILEPGIKETNYQFRIDITASGYYNYSWNSNFTIFILDLTEYEKLESGTNIEDLIPIETVDHEYNPYMGQPTHRKTILLDQPEPVYVLVVNNGDKPINVGIGYYYSVVYPTYYIGIIITTIGMIFIFSIGIVYFTGWKRYFLIGTTLNTFAFFLRIATLPAFFGHPIMYYLTIEMYTDYQTWYMGWSVPFKEGAWLYSNEMFGYEYGPLFMLTLGPFSYLSHAWGMGIPLFLFGIGTGFLVYKIIYKITENERKSIIALLIYFLNPFTLIFSSFTWLNSSIYAFFVILSFYFLLEKRNTYSLVSLGIATMYKQFAVIFFPILLIFIWKKIKTKKMVDKLKNMIKYTFPYCLTILLISLPFLIYDYQTYIDRVFFNNAIFTPERLNQVPYYLGMSVRLMDPIILLGGSNIITLGINYLVAYYVLLGISFCIIYISYMRFGKKHNNLRVSNELFIRALFLSIFLTITVHIFYPRGSYKFYLILLAPFISIFYDHKNISLEDNNNNELKTRYLLPLVLTWGIFFCFRYAYFLILILWMIYYILMSRKYNIATVDQH